MTASRGADPVVKRESEPERPGKAPSPPKAATLTGLPIDWRSALAAATVASIRGGNQVATKLALISFSPFWSAFGRMAISACVVFAWSRARGIALTLEPGESRRLGLLSAVFAVQISLLHWGADLTSPAYAVVLINTNPIFASAIAHFVVPGDRLSMQRIGGLAVSFSGLALVFFGRPDMPSANDPLLGNALIVGSALLLSARTVYIQRVVQTMDPSKAVLWQMIISLPLFAAGAMLVPDVHERAAADWRPWAALAYQGIVVGGAGLVAWVHLLRRHSPGSLSVFSFVTPLAGVLLSAWIFNEALTPRLFLGLASVSVGVLLTTRSTHRAGRPEATPGIT